MPDEMEMMMMMMPTVAFTWTRMPDKDEVCTCCKRPLKSECAMLELDQRTNTYHDRSDVPEDCSQGWFPFGKSCARRIIKEGL